MPVIVMSSPKGGVGKSTTTLILATEFAEMGIPVTIVDADPTGAVERWSNLAAGLPENIDVVADTSEDTIMKTIRSADRDGAIVLVDLAGVANHLNSRAMSKADLVLIVSRALVLDLDITGRTHKFISLEEEVLGRPIPHAFVFTMTAPHIPTKENRHVLTVAEETGIDILKPYLPNRPAFSALHIHGGGLKSVPMKGTIEKARGEATRFAEAVLERLRASIAEAQGETTDNKMPSVEAVS